MNKLKESGQLDKYWLQWKPTARTDCFASQNVEPIKIQIVVSLFIMLTVFVIISVAIYIFEVQLKKKKVVNSTNESNLAVQSQDSVRNKTPMNNLVQIEN